jgi:hypothetical protein
VAKWVATRARISKCVSSVRVISAADHLGGPFSRAGPSWLPGFRRDAFARFSELGFPTTRDEDWHFTSVTPIAERTFFGVAGRGPATSERAVSAKMKISKRSSGRRLWSSRIPSSWADSSGKPIDPSKRPSEETIENAYGPLAVLWHGEGSTKSHDGSWKSLIALFVARGDNAASLAAAVRERVAGLADRVCLVTEDGDPATLAPVAAALRV